jgi:crotonobetainyl-CoA:carnitine CoA-transferase CaiB-like acyl-CoA transferase
MPKDGILSGLKVIDCGTYVAGPAAATILSDFGAEVFKIERPPAGDLFRLFPSLPGQAKSDLNYCWILTGRNRKSVALDLGNPEGRDVLMRMVKIADVFVTNYQRTLLEKFRITWDDLRPINERLVYAHLTGYGDKGDDADAPAFDALAYWARSGLMISVKGLDGSPAGPRPAIGDHPTAMSLFGAIMLGLYHRERTGRGSKVGTSLLASGAWAHACDLQAKICGAEFPERGAGKAPINPLTTGYLSRDGKIVMLVLLDPENEFPRLCRGIGHPDLATNPMFATQDARTEHSAELFAILQSQVESRDLAELKKIFAEYDIKWSTIPTMDEVIADPQMRAAGAFIEYDQPGHGTMETINSPIFMAGVEKRRPAAAPKVGAHTRQVLAQLGYNASEIEQLMRRGAALAGD